VSNKSIGSAGIVKALHLNVKPRRVQQVLQEAANLRYKRIQRTRYARTSSAKKGGMGS